MVYSGARSIRETAGPTELAVGAIADGEELVRVGATVIGSGARSIRETGGPTALVVGAVADREALQRVGATIVGIKTVIQAIHSADAAVATGTATIPADDTIPQTSEGNQYLSVTITPKSTSNRLLIEAVLMLTNTAGQRMIAALFQDATAGALAAVEVRIPTVTEIIQTILVHEMAAGTVSATTFKIRAGASVAGTTTFNGVGGVRRFGGIAASFIRVTELTG